MHLSSIDLFGFKSFAQRTHINFGRGITAIVGPNGCGKSNIVDAVRWVLGEQRESALRSERMENVIFSGTNKRRPLGMAEISLTLHDTDGVLPVEFEEVTVTRRLFRSGKSEYLLNKTVCRLRDLMDLFIGTGVGPDAYTIMELKMVEDILSENPEEMRRLLDEALGITRYKQRRKEALRKLADARLDRDRALDILGEVDRQGKALKRQVAKVKAYQRLQQKAARVRSAVVLAHVNQLEAQLQPLSETLKAHKIELEGRSAELAAAEAGLMRIESEILQSENDRQVFSGQFDQAQANYQNVAAELAKIEEEMRANNWQVERNQSEKQKIEAERQKTTLQIEAAQDELGGREIDLPDLQARFEEQQQRFAAADAHFKGARSATQRSREALNDLRDRQAQAIRSAEQRIALIASLQERRSELQSRIAELTERLAKNQDAMTRLQADVEDKSGQVSLAKRRSADLDAEIEALKTRILQLERDLDQNVAQQRQIQVQIEHLQELHRRSSPLYAAGGALAAKFPDDVSAALADELQVEPEFLKAVETALQGLAFSRVLERPQHLESVLDYLTGEKSGRAALLVGEPPVLDLGSVRAFAADVGGKVLAETIEASSAVSRWVAYLLKDAILVADRGDLKRLAPRAAASDFILVTPEGEFADGKGIWIIGTTRDEAPRVVGLSARRSALERQLRDGEAQREGIRGKIAQAQNESAKTQSACHQADIALHEAEQAYEIASRCKLQMEAQLVSNDLLLQQMNREFTEVESRLADLQSPEMGEQLELPGLEERLQVLQLEQRTQEEAEAKALEELEQARTALEAVRIEFERASSEIGRIRDQAAQLQQRRDELETELQSLNEDDLRCAERLEILQKSRQGQQEKVAEAAIELSQLREKLEEFDSSRMELQETRRNANTQVREIRSHLEQLSQQIHQVQLQSVELEAILHEERRKLDGVSLEGLADEPADPDLLSKIERKILSLEPLNLAAEKEYQELQERQEFLTNQLEDLNKAETDLQQTVATLNQEARERFEAGFQRVRADFQKIFQDVFEGGSADLRLADDDPLESDVQLLAAPPGKRIGALTLLSGGEKALTAISLLFAIYLEKPSPFCILDEVDAPLDDENTLRFCRLLQSFSRKTQFLVITHNKRTMTEAQQLLGVTMEEEGISKVVPVKLN